MNLPRSDNLALAVSFSSALFILTLLFLPIANSFTNATASEESDESSKAFLSGGSKEDIASAISIMSTDTMLKLAEAHGIDSIEGKNLWSKNAQPEAASTARPKTLNDDFVDTDPIRSGNEPSIAAHPFDPNIVLAFHKARIESVENPSTDISCDLHRSTDGGKTWSQAVRIALPSEDAICTDPVIRWAPNDGADSDKNVRAYALYMAIRGDGSTSDIFVLHSDDNGLSWSTPVTAISGTELVNIPDKPWIATAYNFPAAKGSAENDIVYLVSMIFEGEFPENPEENPLGNCEVVFVKSSDGGETFQDPDSPLVLAESEGCVPRMETPSVVAGADGSILVCWFYSPEVEFSGTFDIKCKSSMDYGNTFGDEITAVDDKIEMPFWKCPFLSYHRLIGAMAPYMEITHDGVAHMVYAADPSPGDSDGECGDIYYATSESAPWDEWTPTALQPTVNDDHTETFQGFATITSKRVGNGSVLLVAWEDDRKSSEISDPNLIYDIYAATINSDGTISANYRVSDASSVSDFVIIGDYFDASVHRSTDDKSALIIWTDRRDKESIFDSEDDVVSDTVKLTPFLPATR